MLWPSKRKRDSDLQAAFEAVENADGHVTTHFILMRNVVTLLGNRKQPTDNGLYYLAEELITLITFGNNLAIAPI